MKITKSFIVTVVLAGSFSVGLVVNAGNLDAPHASALPKGKSDTQFFKNSDVDWREDFATLDRARWTPEVTASGGGNFEFQVYTDSEDNLFVRDNVLYLKPGLTKTHQISSGQFLKNGTGGSTPDSVPVVPGDGKNYSGTITAGDIGEHAILGCGKTSFVQANDIFTNNGCPVWGKNQIWWLDLGTRCTDNGSSIKLPNNGGCVLSSGYYVTQAFEDASYSYYSIMKPVTSARISTKNSKDGFFKYGRLEVKAKIPKGDWLWPAIWMLPKSTVPIDRDNPTGTGVYGVWPRSGEIDIMEARGNDRGCSDAYMDRNPKSNAGGVQSIAGTLHWGESYKKNGFPKTHTAYTVSDTSGTLDQEFHIFGIRWNETGLYTYLDNDSNHVLEVSFVQGSFSDRASQKTEHCLKRGPKDSDNFDCVMNSSENSMEKFPADIWPTRQGPFDQEFYLILNVAVGFVDPDPNAGKLGYFPDNYCNKPWQNAGKYPVADFYAAKSDWFPTWTGGTSSAISDNAALQISEIRYWNEQHAGVFGELKNPGN